MQSLLFSLCVLVAAPALADRCSSFPGAGFFGVDVRFTAAQPQGGPIARAFTTAYRQGISAAGFRLAGSSNADLVIHGTLTTHIGSNAPQAARPAAGQSNAAEIRYACHARYEARATASGTALIQAVLRGQTNLTVADADVAEHIRCARQLGAARGRADGRIVLQRLERAFANQTNTISVIVTGLPDFSASRAVFNQLKGARCVRSARHDQFTHGSLRASLKSGLTAERLLPRLRASVRNVRLILRGSARIDGRWQ